MRGGRDFIASRSEPHADLAGETTTHCGPSSDLTSLVSTLHLQKDCALIHLAIGQKALTLHKRPEDFAPRLQQWVADHDLQKALEPLAAVLDDVVGEAVREDFPRQGRDGYAGGLSLQDVAEVLEVAVAAADDRVAQFEGGDIGARVDFVGGVHVARGGAVGLGVLDL
jgi:hypothetical protein